MLNDWRHLIKSNSKGHFQKNQQLYDNFSHKSVDDFTKEFIESIPLPVLYLICYLLQMGTSNDKVFPGQKRISNKTSDAMARSHDYSTRQVRRFLKFGKDHDLLHTQRRYNNSSVYYVHPIFKDSEVCKRLAEYVPGFRLLFLLFLWSAPMAFHDLQGNVHLKNSYVNSCRAVSSHMTHHVPSKSDFEEPFCDSLSPRPPPLYSKCRPAVTSETFFVGYRDIRSTTSKNAATSYDAQDGTAKTNFEEHHGFKKKDLEMSDFHPVLDQLKCFKLTQWGKIRLSGFSEATLRHAEAAVLRTERNGRRLKDTFGFFFGVCLRYARENQFKIDWDKVDRLKREMNMPENAEFIQQGSSNKSLNGNGVEQPSSPKRPQWEPPVKKELTFEDKVLEERKYMGLEQSEQYKPFFTRLPADPHVRAAAEFLGPIAPPTPQEIEARTAARKNAWRQQRDPQPLSSFISPNGDANITNLTSSNISPNLTSGEFDTNYDDYVGED